MSTAYQPAAQLRMGGHGVCRYKPLQQDNESSQHEELRRQLQGIRGIVEKITGMLVGEIKITEGYEGRQGDQRIDPFKSQIADAADDKGAHRDT